jgi:hypothetical protein
VDLFGGYKVNEAFSAGIGLNFNQYAGRTDLVTNLENVFISTDVYRGFRPYVYARYDFLPNKRWTPYVGARMGYAFFMNSKVSYNVVPSDGGFYYGEQDLSEYEYLKNLDHSLGIKGGVFGVLDLGAAVHIGNKGSKLSMGVSMDLQPVKFSYNNTVDRKFNFTVGPKIGFSF